MPRHLVTAVAVALLAHCPMPWGASAQGIGADGYRTGVPAVLTPPAPPRRPPENAFMTGYRQAGLPRIVLFFNRDIADTSTTTPVVQRTETLAGSEQATVTVTGKDGTQSTGAVADKLPLLATLTAEASKGETAKPVTGKADAGKADNAEPAAPSKDIDAKATATIDIKRTTELTVNRKPTGGRQAMMTEAQEWLLESGFTSRLSAEGARLVDRATAMRLSPAVLSYDPQLLETAAIRSRAEMAVVIRASPLDPQILPGALQNLIFRVMAIDTRDGQILVDDIVRTGGDGKTQMTPEAVGEAIAAQVVLRLIGHWAQHR